MRMIELISEDEASFARVGDLLKTDAVLSAAVLRAANSPLFGVRGEIKSIPLALITLGLDRVSLLVLSAAVWHLVPGGVSPAAVQPWWRHNLAVAMLCKQLSSLPMVDEYVYMCGLLHSIGQLALFEAAPNRYAAILKQVCQDGSDLLEYEEREFGINHCELGGALLTKWNIPDEIVDAAEHHHDPQGARHEVTGLVHVCCSVSNYLGFAVSPRPNPPIEELPQMARDILNDDGQCHEIAERVEALESSFTA
jgi:putative nucleotidyltransferase with HDIG domain